MQTILDKFDRLASAQSQLDAVESCRQVADAYTRVLHPLNLHMRDGGLADMHLIAANIETLIDKINIVRSKGNVASFSDDPDTHDRIIASIEKRSVDAVVKARAAFVNVLDNEFRQFGWPMKVPTPENDRKLIDSVKVYVDQLNHLQRVSNDGDYIAERTKWHRALSDNWAVAAILRAPLARFRYHFLEKFRGQSDENGTTAELAPGAGTSRFDRPEWAAEFALDRIRETTSFLSEIRIDGPHTADVKFAEGFCRVFAEKIVYDCELALRTSTNDSDADILIAHASETAKQFDNTLRGGIISLSKPVKEGPLFMSSLHVLSMNESFLTTWASSELRLADAQVNKLLDRALGFSSDARGNGENMPDPTIALSREDLEQICVDIVGHIGAASQKCRSLESGERVSTFLKLTEIPLLQALRSRLKEDVEVVDFDQLSVEHIQKCGRSALVAQLLSDALEDRSVDALYVTQEERLGRGFYDHDINRLRALYSSTCSLLSDAVAASFIDSVRSEYGNCTRFGEVWAPDAAVVLTHDISESLVEPLTSLESSLTAISAGVPCRQSASRIWHPIAKKLDRFVFDEVVLQCFIGYTRNAMPAASEQNGYLSPDICARMARQVSFDVEAFVSAFSVVAVTGNPRQLLPYSNECVSLLRIASNKILLPMVSALQEDEELLSAIQSVAEKEDDGSSIELVENALESRFNVVHISARDALELAAIAGHRFAIRLT